MRKFTLVLFGVLFMVATAAPIMATESRQISLGMVGNYLEDDFNIFNWYATLPTYSNMVWMGVAGAYPYRDDGFYWSWARLDPDYPSTFIGASYGLGEEGKFGTLAMFLYDYVDGLNPIPDGTFSNGLPNKFTLMYGYPMEKLSLGFYFNRSDAAVKDESSPPAVKYEHHEAYTTFGLGLQFKFNEKAYLDLAGDLSLASYKEKGERPDDGTVDIKHDTRSMYGGKARLFYQWNETITLIPYFAFRMFNFRLDVTQGVPLPYIGSAIGEKGLDLGFGVGANVKVNEDNLLIFALEPYEMMKYEPSDPPAGTSGETKVTAMPRFMLALESDVKDWLTFRAGAMKELFKWYDKSETTGVGKTEETSTSAPFSFFTGLGFHVSDFDIDLVLNNNLPLRLGYWLTGYQRFAVDGPVDDLPIYQVTATYHF